MTGARKEKVLILVKTYPVPSTKYVELVCTAGIREDGSWVRIFPVPYRCYDEYKQYKKYQWIECRAYKSPRDSRPESFHIDRSQEIRLLDTITTSEKWSARRKAILNKCRIFTKKSELIEASKTNSATLAVFKPTSIRLVYNKAEVEELNRQKLAKIEASRQQLDMFEDNEWRKDFKSVKPLPYEFKYEITDDEGVVFKHKIIDWELGALFWGQYYKKGLEGAKNDVIKKYGQDFLSNDKDIYLYMGTMYKFQNRNASNPWTIIGVAPFPKVDAVQPDFFE